MASTSIVTATRATCASPILADELSELKTICHCGRKATMVVRVRADGTVEREGEQVEIGGNERYLLHCRRHYFDATGRGRPA
ncbi:MAG: hypothetical protein WAW79_05320 [Steroidobacteraceae bacterium]